MKYRAQESKKKKKGKKMENISNIKKERKVEKKKLNNIRLSFLKVPKAGQVLYEEIDYFPYHPSPANLRPMNQNFNG